MPENVCMGATLKCTFGAAPSKLVVLPLNRVMTSKVPAANIMDHKPFVNILPFGTCTSMANPAVAAATSAAMGVLTPMPCTPATAAPWAPGAPNVMIANQPALDTPSKLVCSLGGSIMIQDAGQTTHQIP
jgi:Domain of unknown function (DUF4280)